MKPTRPLTYIEHVLAQMSGVRVSPVATERGWYTSAALYKQTTEFLARATRKKERRTR
jgi:hypothetical protein